MNSTANNPICGVLRRFFLPLSTALLLMLTGCSVLDTVLGGGGKSGAAEGDAHIVVVTDSAPLEATGAPESNASKADTPDHKPREDEPEAQDHELLSPTTGRPLPEGAVYRPVLVAMDNAAQARPQTALMLADIVYEFPLDRTDHATRYLALFSDELPERVGPVRSSRSYLSDTALEWDGLYVSQGDPEISASGYPLLATSGIHFLVTDRGSAADYFYRDKTITAIEEHTLFFKLREYVDANYNFTSRAVNTRFTFESDVIYDKGKEFTSVGIPFSSSDPERVFFTYDKVRNVLVRSDKNSKNVLGESKSLTPTDDALGYANESVTVQNLIVQFVRVSAFDSNFRSISVTGEGDCAYFVNGRTVSGKWKRPSLDEPTTYLLYDGTVLRLEPGNTWIMMMPNLGDIKVRYAG
ncbi:MAG: DUF3048 domain-containing protein [Christensenella sp.]|nr:DUF3048 domain-containing protein [Christensenella sp.]